MSGKASNKNYRRTITVKSSLYNKKAAKDSGLKFKESGTGKTIKVSLKPEDRFSTSESAKRKYGFSNKKNENE